MKSKRVQDVQNLAIKHNVISNRDGFIAGCPGVMNSNETVEINPSWGNIWSGVNADKTDRFNQFEKALNAVDAAVLRATLTDSSIEQSSFQACKKLFTQMNVYGRAMFMHIIKQNPNADVRTNVFMDVAKYVSEGLDFNGTCNKNNVGTIYKAHIAPKIDEYIASLRKEEEIRQSEIAENKSIPNIEEKTKETLTEELENPLEVLKQKLENLEVIKYVRMSYKNIFIDSDKNDYYYISGEVEGENEDFIADNDLVSAKIYKNYLNMRASCEQPIPNKLIPVLESWMQSLREQSKAEVMKLKDVPLFNLSEPSIVNETVDDSTMQIKVETNTSFKKTAEKDAKEEVLGTQLKLVPDIADLIDKSIVYNKDTGIGEIKNAAFNLIHKIIGEGGLESPAFDLLTSQVVDGSVKLIADIAISSSADQ